MCYNMHMKARTNVSIDKDLLDAARKKKIVISSVLEKALREELKKAAEESWVAENKDSIKSYNKHIDTTGVFSDDLRTF